MEDKTKKQNETQLKQKQTNKTKNCDIYLEGATGDGVGSRIAEGEGDRKIREEEEEAIKREEGKADDPPPPSLLLSLAS